MSACLTMTARHGHGRPEIEVVYGKAEPLCVRQRIRLTKAHERIFQGERSCSLGRGRSASPSHGDQERELWGHRSSLPDGLQRTPFPPKHGFLAPAPDLMGCCFSPSWFFHTLHHTLAQVGEQAYTLGAYIHCQHTSQRGTAPCPCRPIASLSPCVCFREAGVCVVELLQARPFVKRTAARRAQANCHWPRCVVKRSDLLCCSTQG